MNRAPNAILLSLVSLLGAILPSCDGSDDVDADVVADVAPNAPLAPAPLIARPPAPAAGSACVQAREGVVTIERPMFPGRAGSATFGYSFKVHPGTNPSAPTVIYLPGGPGEASIATERNAELLPADYTVIQTDPRGVGCNAPGAATADALAHYPDEFYDSVALASDVLGIVQELELEEYVLYGVSYGTLLATITAAKAEAEGFARPLALVLEGVVGQTFAREGQAEEAFQRQWRVLRDRLDAPIRAQLVGATLPLGLSGQQWGAGLTTMLSLATLQPPLTVAESLLLSLAPEASEQERQSLRDTVLALSQLPVDDFGLRLHDVIACHEITETNFHTLSLEGGELVPTDTFCTSEPLDRPYAAADWPVSVPIYYFSGSDDPNTPPWQAQAHFDAMVTAPRQLVSIIAAGHNPLAFNLLDCQPALWAAMLAGSGFDAAVSTCPWPTQLTAAPTP